METAREKKYHNNGVLKNPEPNPADSMAEAKECIFIFLAHTTIGALATLAIALFVKTYVVSGS